MDSVIYQGFKGQMNKVGSPRLPQNSNFVITYKGMDWSGFRTLANCERQFAELEARPSGCDDFQVVER